MNELYLSSMEAPLMTDYVTPKGAAERLHVSRATIWRWINKGYFEGVRRKGPGETSPNMIPIDSVERLAEQLGIEPEEPPENGVVE